MFSVDFDPCGSNPCLNGGSCSINGLRYFCQCVTGYQGLNCGGGKSKILLKTELNAFECCFNANFGVVACTDLNACAYNHCHWPNGYCTNIRNGTAYTCTCRVGVTGRYCENGKHGASFGFALLLITLFIHCSIDETVICYELLSITTHLDSSQNHLVRVVCLIAFVSKV
jgi:hypothetical protein